MKSQVEFKVLRRGEQNLVVLTIEHPDFIHIPQKTVNGICYNEVSVVDQIYEYLDNIDKHDIMVENDFHIILDYRVVEVDVNTEYYNEFTDFKKYVKAFVKHYNIYNIEEHVKFVMKSYYDTLFNCGKSHVQKLKEILTIITTAQGYTGQVLDHIIDNLDEDFIMNILN
jgi:hypothetical protein